MNDKTGLILIGAGGHALSVYDSIDHNRYHVCGFIDEIKTGNFLGKPIFGVSFENIPDYRQYHYFICIGDVYARLRFFQELIIRDLPTINIIDKSAFVSPMSSIGRGNFIGKQAIIDADVIIGDNNLINTRALIEHGCRVGSHTNISTASTLNGDVVVEDGVYFGSMAVCNGQIHIGAYSVVGSGSVVTHCVDPHTTVIGVPARPVFKGV